MRSPKKPKYLAQPLLPLTSVQIGRFIVNVRQPQQGYHYPASNPAPHVLKTTQSQLSQISQSEEDVKSKLDGTVLVVGSYMKRSGGSRNLSTESSTIYQLDNSDEWFRAAVRNDETRKWIEQAVCAYGKVYIIVGYQTVRDATVDETFLKAKGSSISTTAPVSAALSGTVGFVPIDDTMDPSFERSTNASHISQKSFVAPGEQVVAIQYRRIHFKWYSSRDLDQASLDKDSRWKFSQEFRGQDQGVNDVCEVTLAYGGTEDTSLSDSESSSDEDNEDEMVV